MRIKNLNIMSFGKISEKNIKLDEKITLIYGKNEAGKSSIASFIRYMLYGFGVSRGAVAENQKKKYMPWESDECLGEMSFTLEAGNTYNIVRRTAAKSRNTVFDENNMPFTEENAGEYFFGLSENAYKKTAFVGQKDAVFTDEGELDSAIRNMVYSADESVDAAKVLKKLETLRKYYLGKTGKSGKLYELDTELEALKSEREKWKDGHKELLSAEYQLSEISKKLAFNRTEKQKLEKEKQNLECLKAKNLLMKMDKAREQVETGKKEFETHYKKMQNGTFAPDEAFCSSIERLLSDLEYKLMRVEKCKDDVEQARVGLDSIYSDEVQKNVFQKLSEKDKTPEQIVEEIALLKKKKTTSLVLAIILLVTIVGAVVFFARFANLSKKLKNITEEYGCRNLSELESVLSSGASYKNAQENARRVYKQSLDGYNEEKKSYDEAQNQLSQLLSKAGVLTQGNETDVKAAASSYLEALKSWLKTYEELSLKCREEYVAFNTLVSSQDIEQLKLKALEFDETIEVRDEKTITQQLSFYTQAIDALAQKERELEKKAAVLSGTLPKPSEIQSRILSLSQMREEMENKHAALSMAESALEEASERMKKEAAPLIASKTGELFSLITDGKYKSLYSDSNMGLSFLEEGRAEVKDAGYLSAGTLDAAYIALRISLCEFLYKERPTLIFDDAFAFMDDERLEATLAFLEKLSEKFQIIIFSCHDREKKYLQGKAKIIDFEV